MPQGWTVPLRAYDCIETHWITKSINNWRGSALDWIGRPFCYGPCSNGALAGFKWVVNMDNVTMTAGTLLEIFFYIFICSEIQLLSWEHFVHSPWDSCDPTQTSSSFFNFSWGTVHLKIAFEGGVHKHHTLPRNLITFTLKFFVHILSFILLFSGYF